LVAYEVGLPAGISEFAAVNQIFADTFPVDPPARMTMQVPLPMGYLISVGCVALVDAAVRAPLRRLRCPFLAPMAYQKGQRLPWHFVPDPLLPLL
jgi:hypothetical protein